MPVMAIIVIGSLPDGQPASQYTETASCSRERGLIAGLLNKMGGNLEFFSPRSFRVRVFKGFRVDQSVEISG